MKLIKLKLNCITLKQFLIKKNPGGIVPIIEYLPTTPSPSPPPPNPAPFSLMTSWQWCSVKLITDLFTSHILAVKAVSLQQYNLCTGSHFLVIFPMIQTYRLLIHTFIKIKFTRCRHVIFAHILDLIKV